MMEKLQERLDGLATRAQEIVARLNELDALEGDDFTDEVRAEYDTLMAEAPQVAEDRAAAEKDLEARQAILRAAEKPAQVASGVPSGPVADRSKSPWDYDELRAVSFGDPSKAHGELRSRAITAAEKTPRLSDRQREALTKWLEERDDLGDDVVQAGNVRAFRHILAVANPEYHRHFTRTLGMFGRTGQPHLESQQWLQRAMSLTDASGGYAVPLPIDPTIVVNDDGTESPFRQISTIKTITTDQLRSVNTTAVSASWDGEAAQVSDDATTYANTDITVYKAQGSVIFSIEIQQDFPDLLGHLGGLIATEKGDLEAAAHATGSGTNQPVGIVTALTGGSYEVSSNGSDAFALSDVYDLEEELPAKYRRRAVWTANKRVYQAMREAGGANLDDFWANLGQGQPNQLLGYPTYEASEMDGTWGSGENYVLVFGDFSNFWIVDRVGLSVEMVPHMFATANNRPSGERGLYFYWRTGSDSVNDRAFRMLNVT